jgi:small ubiquitin-related modifier
MSSQNGAKRARTELADDNQAQTELAGREQLCITSSDLQDRLGRKYCDEAELMPLLFERGLVRRVRTIEVEVRPLGGDSFRVTLDGDKPSVEEAKAEIARTQGTKEHRQELYRVAVRADGKSVREDDAEPELLEDETMLLGAGDVVTVAVKEEDSERTIVIVVQTEGAAVRNSTYFKVKMSTRMQKLFHAYAMRYNINAGNARFLLNNVVLENDHTAMSLGMEDHDTIICELVEDN